MTTKVQMICKYCGSANIARDASAVWDIATQDWEIRCVYDNTTCDDCGEDANFCDERPLTEGETVLPEVAAPLLAALKEAVSWIEYHWPESFDDAEHETNSDEMLERIQNLIIDGVDGHG